MDKTARIFLACVIGGGIGTLVALQLDHFWGFGALLGGLVGYLVYDLEQVIEMIPVAWNKVSEWKPNKEKLTRISLAILFPVNVAITSILVPIFLAGMSKEYLITLIGIYGWCMVFYLCFNASRSRNANDDLIYVLRINPFTVYIYYPAKMVIWAVPRIPSGLMIIARFIKTLFVLIHSDLRLLCGIDSLIGSAIGYFTGNVLIGALVGGVLGVLNYELVSKRWLKVELRS
jgi:hypothetical protein